MISTVLFSVFVSHVSLPPKKGFRISFQIQAERNECYKFGIAPKDAFAPLNQDPKEPLHALTHGLVESCLQNVSQGKAKDSFGAIGKQSSWIDFNVKSGKESPKTNGTNESCEALQQSLKHMGDKKSVGSFPNFVLKTMKIEKHQVKYFRVVRIRPSLAFCPHNDCDHLLSSDKQVTTCIFTFQKIAF